jgi:acyl dehydratase
MPISRDLIGSTFRTELFEYGSRELILYALGVGAGIDEIHYLSEYAPGGLRPIPSFGVLAINVSRAWLEDTGFDLTRLFHGEHRLRLHRPIPLSGPLHTETTMVGIEERKSGTFVRFASKTVDDDGSPVCDNEYLFIEVPEVRPYRPKPADAGETPAGDEEPPDFEEHFPIPLSQAAVYRLSGDDNPLHIDQDFAARAGFDRPILHGLCSFGHATRAVIAHACGGNPDRLREISVRFAAPVFPGDTLTVTGRRVDDTTLSLEARTENGAVLTHGQAEFQITD